VLLEDALLSYEILERAAKPVPDVSMPGEDAQGPPLSAAADEDLRPTGLQRAAAS
jgi:hypothetical protein